MCEGRRSSVARGLKFLRMKSLHVVFALKQIVAAICVCLMSTERKRRVTLVMLEHSIKVGPGKSRAFGEPIQNKFGAWSFADTYRRCT